ncbi:his operon leader peptide [Serratia entomophila]|uniref:his operon leader peptide n=1 Tax=Serratia entomophila TaxID=42906 RepID=A0ABY5CYJ5_9GAMM|nr:his operon leader peptide [Serratia entomophila]USV03238.1 his operon leader peptide [Serratia entomophila]
MTSVQFSHHHHHHPD